MNKDFIQACINILQGPDNPGRRLILRHIRGEPAPFGTESLGAAIDHRFSQILKDNCFNNENSYQKTDSMTSFEVADEIQEHSYGLTKKMGS